MKKSSIFSREYEKKIRRKRFTILTVVLVFFTGLVYYIINFYKFNDYVKNVYYSIVSRDKNVDEVISEKNEDKNETVNLESTEQKEIKEELYYELLLEGNEKINVPYSIVDNLVVYDIKALEENKELEGKYRFDISPNKNKILVEDLVNKSTYMINSDLKSVKLDPEYYYSKTADTKFYKENVLNEYVNYLWYTTPRFLDNNTVIYVSNLPWFGKNEQYIWKTDVSNESEIKHSMTSIAGENIVFEELTEEGIKVNINNEIKLLTFSFVLN